MSGSSSIRSNRLKRSPLAGQDRERSFGTLCCGCMCRVVTIAIALTLSITGCGSSVLDDGTADGLVAAHNERRASATPTPDPPLPPLAFDDGLSRTAQAWAARCVFEHSTEELGENLAFFSGDASTPGDVVGIWADEDVFYDYAANACDPGEVCGHYTQVVWRATTRVGCGVSTCTIDGFEGQFWVCNYDPPGNFVGERPY